MASVYLTDMQFSNSQLNSTSANTALSAFEKDMFGGSTQNKAQEHAEVNHDSLSYLFSIFAY